MIRKLLYLGIAVLLCGAPGAGARGDDQGTGNQGQTIKVKTELVEVRAVVTDRQGRFIENLDKNDFELLVSGKPRAIEFFSFTRVEDQEASPGAPARDPAPKSVRARLTEPPARTVILCLDTLHLSVSSLALAKKALRKFVDERLTEQDMVALVTSTGSLGIAEQFTRNRELLRYAIEKISPGPMQRASFFTPYLAACIQRGDSEALTLGIALLRLEDGMDGDRRSMEMMARGRAAEILSEAAYLRKATLYTLKELAAMMAELPGQRMIVLFSDGFTMHESGGSVQTSEVDAATSRAVRSGVVIYSIDAKGLQPPPLFNAAMRGGAAGPRLESYVSASESEEQEAMNALAADTGGEMFRNTNDLGNSLAKAFDANKSYYVLGYYLANEGNPRQFNRMSVRVKNHPEYVVRSPKGYFSDAARAKPAEAEATPAQRVARAIQEPLPKTVIGVSASADYFEADEVDGQVTLTVRVDGDNLQYREENQRPLMELEITSLIFNSSGKQVDGFTDLVKGNLAPERLVLAQHNGYRLTRRLQLKPGIYQVRSAVRETSTDRIGTAFAWVEVPNPARSRFALSSLILLDPPGTGKAPASDSVPAGPVNSRVVQGVRLFPHGQACAYFIRIQKGGKSPADIPLVYQTELTRSGKTVLQQDWQPATSPEKDSKGITLTGQINLADLGSGIYELRVAVKEPQSKRVLQRTAVFGIE